MFGKLLRAFSPVSPGTAFTDTRRAGIDVLRGFCILLVILLHLQIRIPFEHSALGAALPRELRGMLLRSGYYGVMIFFVISGFLITSLALRRWPVIGQIRPVEFYRLRAARLAPTLLVLMVILSVLHLLVIPGYVIPAKYASLPGVIFAALTFRINTLEATGYFLPAGWGAQWSLAIEETFYLFFPLCCRVLSSERRLAILLGLLVAVGPIARVFWADHDDHTYLECMDGIALGCLAALAVARLRITPQTARVLFLVGLVFATLVFGFRRTTHQLGLVAAGLHNTVLETGIGLMLIGIHQGVGRRIFSTGTAPLRLLGRCSYEIYLTHSFITVSLVPLYKTYGADPWIPLWYLGAVAVCALLGWCVHAGFSEPLNRRLRGLPPLRRPMAAQPS